MYYHRVGIRVSLKFVSGRVLELFLKTFFGRDRKMFGLADL